MDFPRGTSGKEPTCQCRRCKSHRFNLGSGRSLGRGDGNPLQHPSLENSMDRGAWKVTWGCKESGTTEDTLHTRTME